MYQGRKTPTIITTTSGQVHGHNEPRTLVLEPSAFDTNYKLVDVLASKHFTITFVTLFLITSLNLFLSLWIIKSLQLGSDGLGTGGGVHFLKSGGMDIRTDAKFEHLTASKITINPKDGNLLTIEPKDGKSIEISSSDSKSFLSFGSKRMEIQTPRFLITDTDQKQTMFEMNSNEMTINNGHGMIGAEGIKGIRSGGYSVQESINTDAIFGTPSHDLRIESRLEGIKVHGRQSINLESRAGSVAIHSLHDTDIESKDLRIDSKKVSFKGLKVSKMADTDQKMDADVQSLNVCALEDGKLFLSSSSSCSLSSSASSSSSFDE